MKISDLSMGTCSVTLMLRNGEKRRVRGRVTEEAGMKYLITQQSPKKSFGPGTKVLKVRATR